MKQVPQEFQDLAYQILENEAEGNRDPLALLDGGVVAIGKMRERLWIMVGDGGFRAIFSRAMVMAAEDFPFLKALQPEPQSDILLEAMTDRITEQGVDSSQACDGLATLLANTLWLLTLLIGKDLMLQQIGSIWPKIRPAGNPSDTQEGVQ